MTQILRFTIKPIQFCILFRFVEEEVEQKIIYEMEKHHFLIKIFLLKNGFKKSSNESGAYRSRKENFLDFIQFF